jgi:hypothetical protein
MGKRITGKSGIEFYHCGKIGHITINCETRVNDLLKGKLQESTNVAIAGDPLDTYDGDDLTKSVALFSF